MDKDVPGGTERATTGQDVPSADARRDPSHSLCESAVNFLAENFDFVRNLQWNVPLLYTNQTHILACIQVHSSNDIFEIDMSVRTPSVICTSYHLLGVSVDNRADQVWLVITGTSVATEPNAPRIGQTFNPAIAKEDGQGRKTRSILSSDAVLNLLHGAVELQVLSYDPEGDFLNTDFKLLYCMYPLDHKRRLTHFGESTTSQKKSN